MYLKDIIENWKRESKVDTFRRETIAVHACGDKLFVATQHPGFYIGYHGQLVDKYRGILRDNGYPCDMRFVDLGCGGLRIF